MRGKRWQELDLDSMCMRGLQRIPGPKRCRKSKTSDELACEDPKDDPYEKVHDVSHLVSSATLDTAIRRQTSSR